RCSDRVEQGITGGVVHFTGLPVTENYLSLLSNPHGMFSRIDIGMSGRKNIAIARDLNRERSYGIQPVNHALGKPVGNMLGYDNGDRKLGGEVRQNGMNGLRSSGRGSNGDNSSLRNVLLNRRTSDNRGS